MMARLRRWLGPRCAVHAKQTLPCIMCDADTKRRLEAMRVAIGEARQMLAQTAARRDAVKDVYAEGIQVGMMLGRRMQRD